MIETQRDFKGVWIPKEIWLSKEMTLREKCLLVEIDSLDNDMGCFAANTYLADFLDISASRVSELISSLVKKGYIYLLNEKELTALGWKTNRVIKVNRSKVLEIQIKPSENRTLTPDIRNTYCEKPEYSNTCSNTVINPCKDTGNELLLLPIVETKEYDGVDTITEPEVEEETKMQKPDRAVPIANEMYFIICKKYNNDFQNPEVIYWKTHSDIEAEKMFDHYQANGWKQSNGNPIKDYRACIRNWMRRHEEFKGAKK